MEQLVVGSDMRQSVRPFPHEVEQLARNVLNLTKASILVDNQYLASALSRLIIQPAKLGVSFATDGNVLACDCERIVAAFKRDETPAVHDLLHSVVHCLFLHPYVGSVEKPLWNLACDIAAERVVAEVLGPRDGNAGIEIARIVNKVERDMQKRADAERMYHELERGRWSEEAHAWASILYSDSHQLWYAQEGKAPDILDNATEKQGSSFSDAGKRFEPHDDDGQSEGSATHQPDAGQGQTSNQESCADQESHASQALNAGQPTNADQPANTVQPSNASQASSTGQERAKQGVSLRTNSQSRTREQREWRDEATSMAINLQTLSRGKGNQLVEFIADLQGAVRNPADYVSFLQSFGTLGEVMRLSDDEFDYNFYTYGLKLYGDMPLIEPLEYKEEQRIREFVIVIDTSESVQGQAVHAFVQATFNVLKSTEAFFDRVRLRVIQSDNRVLSDDVIDDPRDLRMWSNGIRVLGGGGTDFRPAFEYVDTLISDGSLGSIDGLLYFTDGMGTYPIQAPSYRTAFVFYDEDLIGNEVPAWALRVILDEGALRKADVRYREKETVQWI